MLVDIQLSMRIEEQPRVASIHLLTSYTFFSSLIQIGYCYLLSNLSNEIINHHSLLCLILDIQLLHIEDFLKENGSMNFDEWISNRQQGHIEYSRNEQSTSEDIWVVMMIRIIKSIQWMNTNNTVTLALLSPYEYGPFISTIHSYALRSKVVYTNHYSWHSHNHEKQVTLLKQ